jgi:hypothetical protein
MQTSSSTKFIRCMLAMLAYTIAMMSAAPLQAQTTTACQPVEQLPTPSTGIAVEQICRNSAPVKRADRVDITYPNGENNPGASLSVRDTIALKTSVIAPSATYLDFLFASDTVRIRARSGSRTTILADEPTGSMIDLEGSGGASFLVQHLHSLFKVYFERFTAAAPGTVFDVDLDDPATATVSVSDGRVSVTRLVSIHLDAEERDVDQIRVTEYITAAGRSSVRYVRGSELWQHFGNASDARERFNRDLEEASKTQEGLLEEDARWNLGRLEISGSPPTPRPKNNVGRRNTVIGAAAAALLGTALILGSNSHKAASPTAQPNDGSSVATRPTSTDLGPPTGLIPGTMDVAGAPSFSSMPERSGGFALGWQSPARGSAATYGVAVFSVTQRRLVFTASTSSLAATVPAGLLVPGLYRWRVGASGSSNEAPVFARWQYFKITDSGPSIH